jgi:class 3 adenylate cyclase/CheY-like chemotaxis protein
MVNGSFVASQTMTFLFTDIVGSTELLARLEQRKGERLLSGHFRVLRDQIERRGGRVVKTLGDGLMAAFITARDAIECAVAIQRASACQINGTAHGPLSIRVGVSSGDVLVDDGDCFGLPVVEASRLCASANGGQIFVAESTRLLTREYGPIGEVGQLELKGLPEPTTVWEAQWPPNALRVRAVLADDAVLMREGIAHVLEAAGIEVVGQASDAHELLRLIDELRPDLAIVDVRMPPTHSVEGLEAAERIRAEHPATGVLILTMEVDPRYAARLRASGPTGIGYLLKERVIDTREFADAARRVAAGGTAFEPALTPSPTGR